MCGELFPKANNAASDRVGSAVRGGMARYSSETNDDNDADDKNARESKNGFGLDLDGTDDGIESS